MLDHSLDFFKYGSYILIANHLYHGLEMWRTYKLGILAIQGGVQVTQSLKKVYRTEILSYNIADLNKIVIPKYI